MLISERNINRLKKLRDEAKKEYENLTAVRYNYHIFSDGFDDYTDNEEEAISMLVSLFKTNSRRVRIYVEFYTYEIFGDEELGEECLIAVGQFPY